ncbi:MAG TPA: hypothetical protein VGK53_21900 [Propionicimonas sp.]|jgi:hypothetical protein
MAWLFVGDATYGRVGGVSLLHEPGHNSIGLVATIAGLCESEVPISQAGRSAAAALEAGDTSAAGLAGCRIVAGGGIVKNWEYPQPTMGVEYRYG